MEHGWRKGRSTLRCGKQSVCLIGRRSSWPSVMPVTTQLSTSAAIAIVLGLGLLDFDFASLCLCAMCTGQAAWIQYIVPSTLLQMLSHTYLSYLKKPCLHNIPQVAASLLNQNNLFHNIYLWIVQFTGKHTCEWTLAWPEIFLDNLGGGGYFFDNNEKCLNVMEEFLAKIIEAYFSFFLNSTWIIFSDLLEVQNF